MDQTNPICCPDGNLPLIPNLFVSTFAGRVWRNGTAHSNNYNAMDYFKKIGSLTLFCLFSFLRFFVTRFTLPIHLGNTVSI